MDGLDFCTVGMICRLHSRQTSHALIDPHVAGGQSKGMGQQRIQLIPSEGRRAGLFLRGLFWPENEGDRYRLHGLRGEKSFGPALPNQLDPYVGEAPFHHP